MARVRTQEAPRAQRWPRLEPKPIRQQKPLITPTDRRRLRPPQTRRSTKFLALFGVLGAVSAGVTVDAINHETNVGATTQKYVNTAGRIATWQQKLPGLSERTSDNLIRTTELAFAFGATLALRRRASYRSGSGRKPVAASVHVTHDEPVEGVILSGPLAITAGPGHDTEIEQVELDSGVYEITVNQDHELAEVHKVQVSENIIGTTGNTEWDDDRDGPPTVPLPPVRGQ